MKNLVSLILALSLCSGLAVPALATEGEIMGVDEGTQILTSEETSPEPDLAPDTSPELAPDVPVQDTQQDMPQDETLPTGFSDLPPEHIFFAAVTNCATMGITSGYSDGTFRPTNTVTRAQFCVMLARAFWPDELKQRDNEANKALGWFVPASKTLFLRGALAGASFKSNYTNASVMDAPISRYDMAMLMTNIMRLKGFTATTAQKNEAQAKIKDYKSIPSTDYQDAVKNVFALGIITGYSDGSFGGSKNMNRGQGCVVIYRMMQYTPAASKPSTGDGTYDDGKPTETPKPSTETGSGSTNTETKPAESTTQTLTNGKPITETNVKALLNELKTKYPDGSTYAKIGTVTKTNIYRQLGYSTNATECAGWGGLVSDYIFGTNAPVRVHTNFNNVKIGDVLFNKYHTQVVTGVGTCSVCGNKAYIITDSGSKYVVNWNDTWQRPDELFHDMNCPTAIKEYGTDVKVITRYPA